KLTLVDSALHVTGELYLPGSTAHARRIGSQVYLVLDDVPRWPADVKWWPQGNINWQDEAAFEKAMRQLEDQDETVIRATALASWLPNAEHKLADGTVVALPWDCGQ